MRPIQVLLAEDDADDRDIFYAFLGARTDIVLLPVAENGEELLAFLDSIAHPSKLPDVIILDHNMPRLSGRQTLEQLKACVQYAHIPVLVYTTYADNQLIETCLRSGASMVVSKPLTQEGYHELVDSFINVLV